MDTGLLILNVYESLKLVARERSSTPPCGMFSLFDNQSTLQFWALNDTARPVTADLIRTRPIPSTVLTNADLRPGDLGHEYRTQLYATWPGGSGGLAHVYEENLETGALTLIQSTSGESSDFRPAWVRSMASGAILAGEIRSLITGNTEDVIVEYPGRSVVLPVEVTPSWAVERTPFGFSHDEALFAYIDGPSEATHSVLVKALSIGGTTEVVFANSEDGGGLRIWNLGGMSPRGDALAIEAERDGGWIYLYHTLLNQSTLYENPTGGTYTRIDMPVPGFAQLSRFTPDGDGLLFDFVDFATHDCQLWHAGFHRTAADSIAVTVSPIAGTECEIPMTASPPEVVSGGSAAPLGPGRAPSGKRN